MSASKRDPAASGAGSPALTPLSLTGKAIQLVPLSFAHVDALCETGLDARLWQSTTIQVRTRAEMEEYVRTALAFRDEGTALPFVIVERASAKVIGSTRYHSFVPEHRRLEIGFTWIAPSWQRTVVNTEAKYLMLRHAFEDLKCIRVEFRTDAENEQSIRAVLRLGAKQEGILRNYRVTAHRGVRDLAVFSMVESEWPRIRTELETKLARKSK